MYSKQEDFTLIELLVVIAIAAVMVTIAFPNLSQWIASRRTTSQAEQIANLLCFARSEAIRLNLPVYVCPVQIKSDGKSNGGCKSAYSGQGVLVFADKDNDKKYTNDATDVSLHAIILDGNQQSGQVERSFKNISAQGKESKGNQFWVFFPNGMFAHSDSSSNINSSSVANGSVRITLTDTAAKDIATKRTRASVVLIDNSGRVETCARPDSREICKYPDSNKQYKAEAVFPMNNKTSYKYPFIGKGRLKTKQSGMTLIEVLVAMFILALGVLALLAVQLRAVSGVHEAESRTIVPQVAQNLIEGMVINPTLSSDSATGWTKKSYTDYIMESPSSTKNYVDNKGKPCPSSLPSNRIDSEQLIESQICQFKNSIRNTLGENADLQFTICLDSKGMAPTLKDGEFDGSCDKQGNVTYIRAAWSEDAETASGDKSSSGLTKDGNKIVYIFQAQIADN